MAWRWLSPPVPDIDPRLMPELATGEPKLLDRLRQVLRVRHYSDRTEKAHVGWVKRYVKFHHFRHPAELNAREGAAFLSHLAQVGGVSVSTHQQALSALLFLYREVLAKPLDELPDLGRPRLTRRLPVMLSREEVRAVLRQLHGQPRLIAALLYGSGLRLQECLRLRVKEDRKSVV